MAGESNLQKQILCCPTGYSENLSKDDTNREWSVSLISDRDADDNKTLARWIKANYEALFEAELEGWYTDESPLRLREAMNISEVGKKTAYNHINLTINAFFIWL